MITLFRHGKNSFSIQLFKKIKWRYIIQELWEIVTCNFYQTAPIVSESSEHGAEVLNSEVLNSKFHKSMPSFDQWKRDVHMKSSTRPPFCHLLLNILRADSFFSQSPQSHLLLVDLHSLYIFAGRKMIGWARNNSSRLGLNLLSRFLLLESIKPNFTSQWFVFIDLTFSFFLRQR